MIRKISGTVAMADVTSLVIDVQGVGYLVHTAAPGTTATAGEEISLWTYLAVRDTALDLYGFLRYEELLLFELLLKLPKIGPKSAAGILSQADLPTIVKAIREEDAPYLTKMSGVTKKTAENIVGGLSGKIDALVVAIEQAGGGSAAALDLDQNPGDLPTALADPDNQHISDIIDALMALGYPQRDAREAVQKLALENPEALKNTSSAITATLKLLGS